MNKNPIDIVIPWVHPNDEIWKKDFNYWKQKETGNKDACRYKDWGFIKYVLRSIDKNCPWCRYVFLVLSGPSQIPSWLNTNNPKLKIVYHKDYIPADFLPTFNSNVIELFYSNIEELSENFILCNDDMFFTQKKNEDFFFVNDVPVACKKIAGFSNTQWMKTLRNSMNKACDFLKMSRQEYRFDTCHVPVCYAKSFQQYLRTKINFDFMKKSKFRKSDNLTHFLFYYIQILSKRYVENNNRGSMYLIANKCSKANMKQPMLCINEGERSSKNAIMFQLDELKKAFPNKSGFEI